MQQVWHHFHCPLCGQLSLYQARCCNQECDHRDAIARFYIESWKQVDWLLISCQIWFSADRYVYCSGFGLVVWSWFWAACQWMPGPIRFSPKRSQALTQGWTAVAAPPDTWRECHLVHTPMEWKSMGRHIEARTTQTIQRACRCYPIASWRSTRSWSRSYELAQWALCHNGLDGPAS